MNARTINTKVLGLAELEKTLKQLPAKLERNVLRGAVRAGGRVFEREAKSLVPVDQGVLRKSIRTSVRLVRGRPMATIKAGGGSAWHARLVEYGHTQTHVVYKGSDGEWYTSVQLLPEPKSVPPQPYMRPAFESMSPAAIQGFATYVRARLAKEGVNAPDPQGRLDGPEREQDG